METLTIVILIAVACVLFKALSWFLICRNASDESQRYRARQLVRLGRGNRRSSAVPRIAGLNDVEKNTPPPAPVIMAIPNVPPSPATEAPANTIAEPQPVDSHQENEVTADSNPNSSEVDSGHTEDSNSNSVEVDAAHLAAGTVAGAAVAAAVTATAADSSTRQTDAKTSESPVNENLEPEPRPDPDSDTSLEVLVPSAVGAGVVSTTIGGAEMAKKGRTADTPKTQPPPMKVTPAPDFDDYTSLSPKNTSPAYSPPSLPTPQYLDPPPPSPSTSRHITLQRKKMARRMKEQEGMDF